MWNDLCWSELDHSRVCLHKNVNKMYIKVQRKYPTIRSVSESMLQSFRYDGEKQTYSFEMRNPGPETDE